MKPLPLRQKLAAWSAAVAIATLLPVGGFTILYVYYSQLKATDDRLRETGEHFIEMFRLHQSTPGWLHEHVFIKIFHPGGRPERFVEVMKKDGTLLYRSDNLAAQPLPQQPPGFSSASINQKPVRAFVMEDEDVIILFAIDVSDIHEVIRELTLAYAAASPFLLSIAWLGCQFIARKALTPVSELVITAKEISADQLDRRLAASHADDEIGQLSHVLNEMFDRLDVSFKQANRFSADASHELKTPLTILRSSIEDMLERQDLSQEAQVSLVSLLEQTAHLSSIIEKLLLLSRVDARQFKLDLQDEDARQLLDDCLEDALVLAEPRGIEIETRLDDSLPVRADSGRFTQILLNLLDNALKYNVPDGKVLVTAHAENGFCVIRIANTGTARLEDCRQQLFERFYRHTATTLEPGHGLGLSIARELAKAHGGDLTLVHSNGEWTEFMFKLPIHSNE